MARSRLTVLSGPAGVGKSSVVAYLRDRHPEIWHSVSATTRPPRAGEVDGLDRFFVDGEEFGRMLRDGELLEHAHYAGNWYGTPRRPVEDRLKAGDLVLLEIEVQGARQVRQLMPDALPDLEAVLVAAVRRFRRPRVAHGQTLAICPDCHTSATGFGRMGQ